MTDKLQVLFEPASVAVVGASRKEQSVGRGILNNLLSGDNQGQVYPVNPQTEEVMGLTCYPSVSAIEGKVDLVVIAIPRDAVVQVMEECVEKGVKAVVVISAGFKEADEKGEELEEKLTDIAQKHEVVLLGPNCLGVINTGKNLNASFAAQVPGKGSISFISQSGAVGVYALEYASRYKIGFAKFATLGNKAVCNENDILEALIEDEQTKVILAYLEDFADAQCFLNWLPGYDNKKTPNH